MNLTLGILLALAVLFALAALYALHRVGALQIDLHRHSQPPSWRSAAGSAHHRD